VSAEEIEDSDRHAEQQPQRQIQQAATTEQKPVAQSDGLKFGNGVPKSDKQLSHAQLELQAIVENHIKEYEPDVDPARIYIALTKYDSYVKKDSKSDPAMVKDAKTGKMIQQMVPANPGQTKIEDISEKAAGVAIGKYKKMMMEAAKKKAEDISEDAKKRSR